MKKGINHWTFPDAPALDVAFRRAKEAGFETFEVCLDETGEVNLGSSENDMKEILKKAGDCGIELSSVATGLFWTYSLTASSREVAGKAKDIAVKMIELASWLEVDTVLVVPGAVDVFFIPESEKLPYEVVYKRAGDVMGELAQAAEKHGVNIGIENVWNKFLLSPLEMRDFIDSIKSPFVGAYFDTGNVVLTGFPEDWIRILGDRILKVHVKDYKSSGFNGEDGPVDGFCNLTEGEVDWKKVVSALQSVGYDGPLTAEMVPPTSNIDKEGIVEKTSLALDKILGR